jgi:signal transduction histidine kinase
LLLLCKSDFKRKQISVVLNFAERLPQIRAISDQIKQVFLNLLNNAADACLGNGGVITISTCHGETRVAVAIQDTGIGIPPEKIGLIFQPFYTTKSETKGTGLGLSVCNGIVRNHHGEIRIKSHPGEGSTFTVLLPIDAK